MIFWVHFRYNQINDSVSHVIVGEMTSDTLRQIQNLNFRYVV
jgi:hypothetical protein